MSPDYNFTRASLLYEGKAKKVFEVKGETRFLLVEFKDSLTAFNAQKKGQFSGKGELNCSMTSKIFRFLETRGIRTHLIQPLSPGELLVYKLKMIPLEVVVRNRVAGSLARRFEKEEGESLESPMLELFYKDDKLGDPFINDEQALWLKAASLDQIQEMKTAAIKINAALKEFFSKMEIDLIDFKVEFGISDELGLVLGDEITPDSCRLWKKGTNEKLDKDRFRRDLGQVEEAYQTVWSLMQKEWREL